MMNSYGTYSNVHKGQECLTIETIRKAMDSIPPCPFETFANEHGFSLDKGDKMILPWRFKKDISREGIIFSKFAKDIYLCKGDIVKDLKYDKRRLYIEK